MHLIVSIWYFLLSLVNALQSFLISIGFLKSYRDLGISKVQYLAVVTDSEEAARTTKVLHLLRWLEAIGIKKLCLYDTEGVLKKSKEALTLCLKCEKISKETKSDPLLEQKYMSLEVISFSDGKHAVAKADNFLLEKHYSGTDKPNLGNLWACKISPGISSLENRYAEMEYIGSLKCMKYGSLVKAIYRFTRVRQNYGK